MEAIPSVDSILLEIQWSFGIKTRPIDWTNFAAIDVGGKAVLVQTGWSEHWGSDQCFEGHPFLTEAAALYLRDQGATLVGIDSRF